MHNSLLVIGILLSNLFSIAQEKKDSSLILLEPGKSIDRKISGGEKQIYKLQLTAGALVSINIEQDSMWMRLDVYNSEGTKIQEDFLGPKGALVFRYTNVRPTFTMLAEPMADYRIELRSLDEKAPADKYRLVMELLPDSLYQAEVKHNREALSWIKQHAIPIRSLTAGNGFSDLQPFRQVLRNVRVVGIGETTHGSREVFQMKHRMIEYLVKELGYTVVALESSTAACEKINDYVLYGKGQLKDALAGQGFWQWDTEEVATMIEWLHDYNHKAPKDKKVKFYGFDYQANDLTIAGLLSYIKKIAPERYDSLAASLKFMQMDNPKRPTYVKFFTLKPEEKAPIVNRVNDLVQFLTVNKKELVQRTSGQEYDKAFQYAGLMAQFADTYSRKGWDKEDAESGVATRDRYMAENILRILWAEGVKSKMVVWTHNGHVNTAAYNMGYYLRRALGKNYYALASSLNEGYFQALEIGGGQPSTVKEFYFGPAFQGSVGWLLHQAGEQNFAVNLREAPTTGPVAAWLSSLHPMRSIGNGFALGNPGGYYYPPVVLTTSFDGIFFIERTTRARPNTPL